ncbi:hypothetical protein, partial [Thomasclavelia cocleata]|uniref:hypothetical protein n=1 Tax=Thomasclavelia cocleata TaxID=69824 RepID=UPI0025A9FE4A
VLFLVILLIAIIAIIKIDNSIIICICVEDMEKSLLKIVRNIYFKAEDLKREHKSIKLLGNVSEIIYMKINCCKCDGNDFHSSSCYNN